MTKIKLDGLRWNNIDLSRGVSEEHKARVAKRHAAPVEVKAVGAAEGGYECKLYVAQHNFVDDEPIPSHYTARKDEPLDEVPEAPAMLPGQAICENAAPFNGEQVPYMSVKGANLQELIKAATKAFGTAIFSEVTIEDGYFSAFKRNGSVYRAEGESELLGTTEDGVASYKWTGWGVTYYTGLFRPALFSQYPPLSISQQVTVADGNAFVIDFTKTEMYYELDEEGNVYLLHGKVH